MPNQLQESGQRLENGKLVSNAVLSEINGHLVYYYCYVFHDVFLRALLLLYGH